MVCAADSGASTDSDEPTATDFLDRLYGALPESMAHTLCYPASDLAAAARAGRPRGLLGMLALANAGVYSNSTDITPLAGASTRQGAASPDGSLL